MQETTYWPCTLRKGLERKYFCEARTKDCSEKPDPQGYAQTIKNDV